MAGSKLRAKDIDRLTAPGRHPFGDGLYLSIGAGPTGGRRWVFRYRAGAKVRELGLGAAPGGDRQTDKGVVSFTEAKGLVLDARSKLLQGLDPIDLRRAEATAKKAEVAAAKPAAVAAVDQARKARTFGAVADAYIKTHQASWKSPIHLRQWEYTLTVLAASLRDKDVADITVEDVLAVLTPIWLATPETASRLRGRIEVVLDAAKVKKLRSGENPAAWRGNLKLLLPAPKKLSRGHHAALPYAELPAFMGRLREVTTMSTLALEFTILTAARSGEVLRAKWGEVDTDAKVWTVPAERMKGGRQHRVPLTPRALEILQIAKVLGAGDYIFRGRQQGKSLSTMAFEMVLRRLDVPVTPHGFRSSFRDWAGDTTPFPRDVIEHCLAHKVGDAVELAYRRGDALERRREVMTAWAAHCEPVKADNVVQIRA